MKPSKSLAQLVVADLSLLLLLLLARSESFVQSFVGPSACVVTRRNGMTTTSRTTTSSTTSLNFGIPSFFVPQDDDESKKGAATGGREGEEKKIGLSGMVQLITAGLGAPFLGDFQGTDEDGKLIFSLEANNLVDENGEIKQTKAAYFENGWVDPEDEGFKFPWQK